jgi:membrane fusion protein (multidrug efflux system)
VAEQQPPGQPAGPEKRLPLWPWIAGTVIVVGFIVIVLVVIFAPTRYVWTDDAYLRVRYTTVAPRISGRLTQILVADNQQVRRGQLLALIDDRDDLASLAQAEAQLKSAKAQVENIKAELARQPALVAQASAQLAAANAQFAFALANDARYRRAAASGADTDQDRQQAEMQLRQARAAVDGDTASLSATRMQLSVLAAQLDAAQAAVEADAASVAQAKLNLSYTRITASMNGMIGELSAQVGNYVAPGAALMALVPIERLYVEANYREVALKHMRPGDRVRIHVDAYDVMLNGVVNSIPPSTGAAFAPIEPNNATGNFTKIVQRLPVKITFLPGQAALPLLRMGMSVETTVDTGTRFPPRH